MSATTYLNSPTTIRKRWWRRYRIIHDGSKIAPYRVEVWRAWLPFWCECDFVNIHWSLEAAERWAARYDRKLIGPRVVKVL